MKGQILIFFKGIIFVFLLLISSCSPDLGLSSTDDCTSEEFQEKAELFIDAAVLYGQDASTENCQMYKAAAEDYLEVIKDCSVLSPVNGIAETEQTIEDLDC